MIRPLSAKWDLVVEAEHGHVRRVAVPGGWLYQAEIAITATSPVDNQTVVLSTSWSNPVFVPEVTS